MDGAVRSRSDGQYRTVLLGLGSNVGDSVAAFCTSLEFLRDEAGCEIIALSSVYETAPVGPGATRYSNAAAEIASNLEIHDLMVLCQRAERNAGRVRGVVWGDRPVDIDILLDGSNIHTQVALTVPHRLLHVRRFVLDPLAEICAEAVHPLNGRSVGEMASHWRMPVLRIAFEGEASRAEFEDVLRNPLWSSRIIATKKEADLTLGFQSTDAAQWPPAIDLRTWPLEPVAAIEAALASVCDEPTLCEFDSVQTEMWRTLGLQTPR